MILIKGRPPNHLPTLRSRSRPRLLSPIISLKRACVLFLLAGLLLLGAAFPSQGQIRDGGVDPHNLGKGDWIYSITDATNKLGGHVNSVTNENSLMLYYKNQGIRYMVVKAGTAATLFNGCYAFPQFTTKLVNSAHTNGILIFGYNRTYGTNVAAEVSIADFVFNQGADGFVWDAEIEWESGALGTQGPSLAWQQCSQVRSNWPNKFLAHAPFPIIYLHASFPYKEFGYWCDAVMPQIYHFGATLGSQSAGINWSDINWKTWQNSLASLAPTNINGTTIYWTNSIKPLAPINDVYGSTGALLCEGTAAAQADTDVMEFIDYLSADPMPQTVGGYQGVSFWRTDLHSAGEWAYIKAGTSGNFTGVVNNIVIDNPKAAASGGWTSLYTWSNVINKASFIGNGSGTDSDSFGTNYLTNPNGTGANTVQFTPNILVPGNYNVYQWHPTVTNASGSVPHFINYNGGSTTVYANQTTNGGNWTLLGRFDFLAGSSGFVRVSDATLDSGKLAIVDGIKFAFALPTSVPAAPTGLSATAISSSQISLAWTDAATNETGYVISSAPSSGGPFTTIASLAASANGYTNNGLSPSTTYYYRVHATNFLGYSIAGSPVSATTQSGAPQGPAISTPPQSQTVLAGQPLLFSVTATGTAPLSYQWRLNGTDLPGATLSSYSIAAAQTNHAGSYVVTVTNSAGAVTSAPGVLTVQFSLAATGSTGGTVGKSPDLAGYAPGAGVTLTALPDPGFAFLEWSGDAAGTNNPLSLTVGANLSIYATFVNTGTDLILDNTNSAATFDGLWQTGTGSLDKFGPDYRFASTAVGGQSNAIFRPYIYNPGFYDVFVWYPQGSNRATNAPWTVYYDGGSVSMAIDQTVNGGSWVLLGSSLPFQKGTNGYVRLSNDTGYSGKVVLADAVRWLLGTANPIHIDSVVRLPDGRARLDASGGPGHVGIDASPNLVSWLELTNFFSTNSPFVYFDPETNQTSRFYRMRLMP
jgi:hypothetical protein